jgi:hypothetical protein
MQGLEQVRIFAELSGQGIVDDLGGDRAALASRRDRAPDLRVGGWMAAERMDLPTR